MLGLRDHRELVIVTDDDFREAHYGMEYVRGLRGYRWQKWLVIEEDHGLFHLIREHDEGHFSVNWREEGWTDSPPFVMLMGMVHGYRKEIYEK